MSDKEFERIMRMEERERIRKKERAGAERRKKEKKVREKRKEQKKKVEQLGADAVWEVTGGDGNDVSLLEFFTIFMTPEIFEIAIFF